jgi:hypothetical protein
MRLAPSHPKAPKKPILNAVPADMVTCVSSLGAPRTMLELGGGVGVKPRGGRSGSVPMLTQSVGATTDDMSELSVYI